MKKILSLALLVCATAVGAQTNYNFAVTWTASPSVFTGSTNILPANDLNLIYITTNVAAPFNTWQFLGSTPGSIVVSGNSNYVAVTSGVFNATVPVANFYFAAMTYSNSAGVSPFSNVGVGQATSFPAVLRSFQKQ